MNRKTLPAPAIRSSSPASASAAASPRRADLFAIAYLNVVLEDADQDELVAALCRIARSGHGARLVEKIELNASTLFRTLCLRGNPELKSAAALLKSIGVRLAVQPLPSRSRAESRLPRADSRAPLQARGRAS